MGLTHAQIAEMLAEDEDEADRAFEVWPENWPALDLFLALGTQWRIGPLGGALGLDYQGVHAAMRMMKVKDRAVMFDDLHVMERAALKVWNEKS
jgi:hypothetical protein